MTTVAPLLTDLAEELAADQSGRKQGEVLKQLDAYEVEVQRLLSSGVPAGQFERVDALAKALASAKEVAQKLAFPRE